MKLVIKRGHLFISVRSKIKTRLTEQRQNKKFSFKNYNGQRKSASKETSYCSMEMISVILKRTINGQTAA